ncbi:hypothetical protein MTR62_20665 [Novosphingobium sp. 1949]|uniref:Uncharacterized protein n=1 Tax=Novosphingobium organovorum TaxID=2930092 RepID=A0ABT0BJ51_9SPHN|nr:hypothetical protein [Novosphingobium organovorum]MCJ2185079.1 hypothetical protein [Novosphingobium organovorum]
MLRTASSELASSELASSRLAATWSGTGPRIRIAALPVYSQANALHGTLADRARAPWLDDNVAGTLSCLYPLHPTI